ncbi:MAG: type I restriction enzyme HsdR N-terminal domain-containing protein [Parachlamydiaceae bacterium]
MECSNLKPKIFCQVRRIYVAHTPEEEVRQSFISHWISTKGYPGSLIAAEVSLASLCPFKVKVPNRRLDLVFFTQSTVGLKPLMLVECKADSASEAALRQLIGYNRFASAPYLCLASSKEKRYGAFSEGGWSFSDREPAILN